MENKDKVKLALTFKAIIDVMKVANKKGNTDSRWLSLLCKRVLVSGILLRTKQWVFITEQTGSA